MHAADMVVLVLYLIGITAIGIWMARKVRGMSDFVMPRRFGKAMMVTHAFGTGTHSDQAVSVAAKTYTNGLSGIWYQWLWLFCTPFYWLIAPVMRRFRALTTADVFELRYDRSVAGLFAVVGLFQFMVNIGLMLLGSSKVIDACTGGAISSTVAIPAMTVLFVAYGVAGGLGAAIVTDFIQGILTVVFSFLLLPFVLGAVGGLAGLREKIGDEEMFSLVAPGEIGVFFIVMITVNALLGIVTQPHIMGNCAAGRTELDGQVGFMGGNFIKRICTIAWCLTGLAAVAYFAGRGIEPDQVFGEVAREFLPKISVGVLGIFIASLLASVMSSCDSFMIASAGLFTENVYRPLKPGRTDRHYLFVARLASLGVVAGGVVFAYSFESVVGGLEVFWKIAAMMSIAFWLGLFWRRATVAAAWASTLAAFAVLLLTMSSPAVNTLARAPGSKGARFVIVKSKSARGAELVKSEIKDPAGLAAKLRAATDPVSTFVRGHLSMGTLALLDEHAGATPVPDELLEPLLADLNRILKEEGSGARARQGEEGGKGEKGLALYDEARFAGVALSEMTRELVAKKPAGKGRLRLNRLLLEEAYPDEVLSGVLFCAADIEAPRSLASALLAGEDAVSAHVSRLLSNEARRKLAEGGTADPDELRGLLAAELSRIALGGGVYDAPGFEDVHTADKTRKLLAKRPSGGDLVKLNTFLLEEAFIRQVRKNRTMGVYLPWQMVFYLVVGLVAGVVVSLYTKPVAEEKLERFYALTRTPVTPGEEVPAPCTLPEGVVPPPRDPLFPESGLEIQRPRASSFIGFGVGWALVLAIILVFVYIAKVA